MPHDPAPEIARTLTGDVIEIRPGRRLSVSLRTSGAREAALFFCHGAGGAKNQWRAQWAAFAESGCKLIAWDFPGHGESPAPRRADAYAGPELVADYRALFAQHRSGRNILIAHSLGVQLTLALLLELPPGAVESVVLLGPPGPGFGARASPLARWPLPLLWLMRPALHAGFARSAWAPSANPALVAFEQKETARNTLFMMQSLMRGAMTLDPHLLGSITTPARILAGDCDGLTPAAGAEALAKALPRARLRVLKDCGHQIMLERPAETNAAIRDALAQTPL